MTSKKYSSGKSKTKKPKNKPAKSAKLPEKGPLFAELLKEVERSDWDAVGQSLERLYEYHRDELNYVQLVAGAKWMLDARNFDTCDKLANAALAKEPERHEAAEVLFFLYMHRGDLVRAKASLVIARNFGGEHPRYLLWEILLFNEQGDNAGILDHYDAGRIPFDVDNDRLSEIVFSVVLALIAANRLADARELVDRYYPESHQATANDPNIINLHAKMNQAEENVAEAVKYFELVESLFDGEQVAIEARWNKSLLQLSYGDLQNGWQNYEVRWDWDNFPTRKFEFPADAWQGEDLAGKSILFWGEQGIGDEILFLTLLPEIFKLGPTKVGIYASEKICSVIEKWYPQVTVYAVAEGQEFPEDAVFDYQLPSGSLALKLGNLSIEGAKQFIRERPETVALRDELLKKFPGKTRIVGLSWRSGILTHKRVHYYLSHHAMVEIIRDAPDDILFVSLQYGIKEDEAHDLDQESNFYVPEEDFFNDLMAQLNYIQACDVVVTSGSVCLALAGITAQPCITWGPKRMWTLLGQDKYPWFPLVHMIKCEINWDHGSLVNQLRKLLHVFYQS